MNEQSNEPLDLDLDLTGLKTGFPVLKAGIKDLKVESITREENKDKNGHNLVVSLVTTEPDEDLDGNPIPVGAPGTKLKQFLALQHNPAGKDTDPDGWRKRIAAFQDACLGTEQGTRPGRFTASDYIGKIVRADVKAEVNTQSGQMSNNIKSLNFPK